MNWKSPILKIAVTLVVAIGPSTIAYMQSVYETRAKFKTATAQADKDTKASYDQLAKSVAELQSTVTKQHDDILALQVYINVLEQFISAAENRRNPGHPNYYIKRPAFPADVKLSSLPKYDDLTESR